MELRPYQVKKSEELSKILYEYGIAYLAGEPRSGKTLTFLNTAEMLQYNKVLVLTKAAAVKSLEKDFKDWGKAGYDVKVMSHGSIHKIDFDFDLLVLDEAHTMSAFPKPSKRAAQLKELTKGRDMILVSGTPSPESYSQLYYQFWLSDFSPFKEKNFYGWYSRNKIGGPKGEKFWVYTASGRVQDYSKTDWGIIRKDCEHLFVSMTRKEAGIDKEAQEEILRVPAPKSIVEMAKEIYRRDEVCFADDTGEYYVDCFEPMKKMQLVNQIFSGTVKIDDEKAMVISTFKVDFIKEYFKGKKIAILYRYVEEGNLLRKSFEHTTDNPLVFNKVKKTTFIRQIVSGREGISLMSADCLVFFNIDFSATSYFQATVRMANKLRKKENKVYWVFSENGIEDSIYEKVIGKKDFTTNHYTQWVKKKYGKIRRTW